VQEQVIQWLAILPLVLAAFRAITIGDRLYAPIVAGRAGGMDRATQNYFLAGLSFVGLALVVIAGANAPALLETAFALILIAFGGFVVAGYMSGSFRHVTWQRFVAGALMEASLYWLVLGLCRVLTVITQPAAAAAGTTRPSLDLLNGAIWLVISVVSLALIIGTGARMIRH
jgi:hypothetical protein